MRGAPTSAEEVLWQALRDASLGTRFRRQHVIDRFIVDFCSLRERLIVEVDGGVHDAQQERDAERDTRLRAVGFRVMRFRNERVFENLPAVLAEIREALPGAD
jgi:very-short-patch-repair endonuclease